MDAIEFSGKIEKGLIRLPKRLQVMTIPIKYALL